MSRTFFKKSSPNVPIYLADGRALKFDRVGENLAVKEVGPELGHQLMGIVAKGIGGLYQITMDEYLSLKKNTFGSSYREELGPKMKVFRNHQPIQVAPAAPVAPVAVPKVEPPPATPVMPVGARPTARKRK